MLQVRTVTTGGDSYPLVRDGREKWNIPDPKGLHDEFRKVRDLIEQKVRDLLGCPCVDNTDRHRDDCEDPTPPVS
jgi:hypothetical protein